MSFKKTYCVFFILFLIILTCVGCGKSQKNNQNQEKEIKSEKIATLESYEDNAAYWYEPTKMSFGEDVVVRIDSDYIKYIDPQSGENIYACSRTNCTHNTKECQANFGEGCEYACIYEKKLYVIIYDEETKRLVGYESNIDGSERKEKFKIESDGRDITDAFCANGQAYFNVNNIYIVEMDENQYSSEEILYDAERQKNTIYGIEFKTGKVAKLIDFPTMSSSLVSRMYYEKGALFVEHYYREKSLMTLADYVDDDLESFQAIESAFWEKYDQNKYNEVLGVGCKQYVYLLREGKLKEVTKDFLFDAGIKHGNSEKIIFGGIVNKKEATYVYDIKNDTVIEINQWPYVDIYVDGRYIYAIQEGKKIKYFEFDGEKSTSINELSAKICSGYIAENETYIFYENEQDEDENIYSISKKDFWEGKDEGVIINK